HRKRLRVRFPTSTICFDRSRGLIRRDFKGKPPELPRRSSRLADTAEGSLPLAAGNAERRSLTQPQVRAPIGMEFAYARLSLDSHLEPVQFLWPHPLLPVPSLPSGH